MKLKESFFYTIREDIKDEESISGKLLVKSGMIKKIGSGIYSYMPLGLRVAKKIEEIVRDEMNKAGAQEVIMPSIIPEEYYIESGRRDAFGSSMLTLKDRYSRNYVLGPTHEELFLAAAKEKIKSYKDMPFNLYQMANKYRDEARPRYGLIRVREFVMKDAYSFDKDLDGLNASYQKMFQAYKNIYNRIGIDYTIVTADTGAMGGLLSEEFQAITNIGEDTIVLCAKCDYSSNLEITEVALKEKTNEFKKEKELIHTPNVGKIEDFKNFTGIDINKLVKTLIYNVDGKYYACMVLGNREINEVKVMKLLNAAEIELADHETVKEITKAEVGFAGPINLNIPIIMDPEIETIQNFVIGANKTDYHYLNTNIEDFKVDYIADIKLPNVGDSCPKCKGSLIFKKGIEIGNTFKLGTKYSEAMNLHYLDENNELKPVVMGSYGIGIGRIIASYIEQNNDEAGIIFNKEITPYQVAIVLIDANDSEQSEYAENLYNELNKINIDAILDNRDARPGVKFNDIDLIGIPIRITIGKKLKENIVELKLRNSKETIDTNKNEIIEKIKEYL